MPAKPSEVLRSGGSLVANDVAYYGNDENFFAEICSFKDPENPTPEEIMLMDLDDANEDSVDSLFNTESLYEFLQQDGNAVEFNNGSLMQVDQGLGALECHDEQGALLARKDNKLTDMSEIMQDYNLSTESRIERHDLGFFLDNYL